MAEELSVEELEQIRREAEKKNWWVSPEKLGVGGGGQAYLAIRVEALNDLRTAISQISQQSTFGIAPDLKINIYPYQIINLIRTLTPPSTKQLGAWKVSLRPDVRMKREIEVLKQCKHPNLIELYDADDSAAPRWYIMQFFPNGPLSRHYKTYHGRPLEVLTQLLELTEAVQVLHKNKYIHRDIKPDNIFIGDNNRWILGDLGIAAASGEPLTEHGFAPMTKEWRPEWVMERKFDDWPPTVDVHMLCKVAYAMISGGKNPPPSQLDEPDFDLRSLFPDTPFINETHQFIINHVTSKEKLSKSKNIQDFIDNLKTLLVELKKTIQQSLVFSWLSTHSMTHIPATRIDPLGTIRVHLPRGTRRLFGAIRIKGEVHRESVLPLKISLKTTHGDIAASTTWDIAFQRDSREIDTWCGFNLPFKEYVSGPYDFGVDSIPPAILATGLQIYSEFVD